MRLAGIDLGVRKIAISVFLEGELESCHVYESPEGVFRDVQLKELAGFTEHICGSLFPTDAVWIEDTIIGNNRKYSIKLAQTMGAVQSALGYMRLEQGTDTRVVDNKTWKKVIVGNGNANKDTVRDYIDVTHPAYALLCDGDQDLYDATCVGLYGLHIWSTATGLRLQPG